MPFSQSCRVSIQILGFAVVPGGCQYFWCWLGGGGGGRAERRTGGLVFFKIILRDDGKFGKVLQALHVRRLDLLAVPQLAVKLRPLVGEGEEKLEPVELDLLQSFEGNRLHSGPEFVGERPRAI